MYKRESDFVQSLNASIQGQPWLPTRRPFGNRAATAIPGAPRETQPPMPSAGSAEPRDETVTAA